MRGLLFAFPCSMILAAVLCATHFTADSPSHFFTPFSWRFSLIVISFFSPPKREGRLPPLPLWYVRVLMPALSLLNFSKQMVPNFPLLWRAMPFISFRVAAHQLCVWLPISRFTFFPFVGQKNLLSSIGSAQTPLLPSSSIPSSLLAFFFPLFFSPWTFCNPDFLIEALHHFGILVSKNYDRHFSPGDVP